MAEAQRRAAAVAGALTIAAGDDQLRRASLAAGEGDPVVVHGLTAPAEGSHAEQEDVTRAARGTEAVLADAEGARSTSSRYRWRAPSPWWRSSCPTALSAVPTGGS
ncbi:hypothetical protein Phou_008700 [Phytohabitans houttuyneae]|uniref:Uncharacterized protein n=1 Tax=Phytohabitans houttuyneae TaxID=1076126 RepID=A0A6V8JZF7_9ACTN|nr:hypothetical protein Phou_008700 [Phytohabitans houttuyneae]